MGRLPRGQMSIRDRVGKVVLQGDTNDHIGE